MLRYGHRFSREERLVHGQGRRRDEADVRRDPAARFQKHQVAGDEVAAFDLPLPALADDARSRGHQSHQRPHGNLSLALLGEADGGIERQHRGDHRRVDVLAQQHRHDRGCHENIDERALELVEQDRQVVGRWGLLQLVGAVMGQPGLNFGLRKTVSARPQDGLDLGAVEGMPRPLELRVRSRRGVLALHFLAISLSRSCLATMPTGTPSRTTGTRLRSFWTMRTTRSVTGSSSVVVTTWRVMISLAVRVRAAS